MISAEKVLLLFEKMVNNYNRKANDRHKNAASWLSLKPEAHILSLSVIKSLFLQILFQMTSQTSSTTTKSVKKKSRTQYRLTKNVIEWQHTFDYTVSKPLEFTVCLYKIELVRYLITNMRLRHSGLFRFKALIDRKVFLSTPWLCKMKGQRQGIAYVVNLRGITCLFAV